MLTPQNTKEIKRYLACPGIENIMRINPMHGEATIANTSVQLDFGFLASASIKQKAVFEDASDANACTPITANIPSITPKFNKPRKNANSPTPPFPGDPTSWQQGLRGDGRRRLKQY